MYLPTIIEKKLCNTQISKVNVSALISSARLIKFSPHKPYYSILRLLLLSHHFVQGVRCRSNQICYINQINIYNISFQGCLQPCQTISMKLLAVNYLAIKAPS